jgi:hypothetical protein
VQLFSTLPRRVNSFPSLLIRLAIRPPLWIPPVGK